MNAVDVSDAQGRIDWSRMDGVLAAYMKVSEGTGHVDGMWMENYKNARAVGILVGPYHYLRNDMGDEQGLHFRNQISRVPHWDLPPALDCEDRDFYLGKGAMSAKIQNVAELSGAGAIYTSIGWWHEWVGTNAAWAKKYWLWVAHWGATVPQLPQPWTEWLMWQYAVLKVGKEYGAESEWLDLDMLSYDRFLVTLGAAGNRCGSG